MSIMNIVAIGSSLEEIIISCSGTLINNTKNGGKTNIIITNIQKNTKEKNGIKKTIEKIGIKISIIESFDFLITTQNNVKLIQKIIKKYKPDTLIIPHYKSKKKENGVLGTSSILAGRQIKNILMYGSGNNKHSPTVFQSIENENKIKTQWVNTLNKGQRKLFRLFLEKVDKINKDYKLKQKHIELYHSFRMVLE